MATTPNHFPADTYTVVPIAQLTRVTSLADELRSASQDLAASIATSTPSRHQSALPSAPAAVPVASPTAAVEPDATRRRISPAEAVATREHLYKQIHATGTHGATTADLAALSGEQSSRVHPYARTLEAHGRIFRNGNGTVRWYATEHRTAVLNAMRRRVPNHDLTVAEASDILGLSPRTIRDMADAKQLAGRRVGNSLLIHPKGVLAHINTIGATPPADTTTQPTQPAA